MIWWIITLVVGAIPFAWVMYIGPEKMVNSIDKWLKAKKIPDGRLSCSIITGTVVGSILLSVAIFLIALFSPSFYEFPSGLFYDRIYTFENGKAIYHPWGTWEDKSPIALPRVINLNPQNCRVCKHSIDAPTGLFDYKIEVTSIDPQKYLAAKEQSGKGLFRSGRSISGEIVSFDIHELMHYLRFEFRNTQNGLISRFYNPYDMRQQTEFGQVVNAWFQPEFEKSGIKVTIFPTVK